MEGLVNFCNKGTQNNGLHFVCGCRLELELERDKRERDARERELREQELRSLEMREKLKAEMEMKPPGWYRGTYTDEATSLDHWGSSEQSRELVRSIQCVTVYGLHGNKHFLL